MTSHIPKDDEWRFPLDERRKAQSLAVIRQKASKKRIRHYPAFPEHLWNQLRFKPLDQWLTQGGVLMAAMLLALWLRRENIGSLKTVSACSVFLVFAGNICLNHAARLFSWHMAELEQTLYLNLKQLICIRMLEAGIADLIILALFLGITGHNNTMGIGVTLLYMMVPFLWSDTLYLHMLIHIRSTSYGFRSFTLGLLCGILALFPVLWTPAYEPENLILWKILAFAGLSVLIAEIYSILMKIERGDQICLN